MARVDSAWTIRKGHEDWKLVEQIRLSPAPKLGGWAGTQLRFLSVSRGQSVLTDVQPGSLAVNRRVIGLPSMQRMWFARQGHSLGYTKARSSGTPELFFFDPEARLWSQKRLPPAVADACAGTDQWFVACRNGRVYAFGFDGSPLWNALVPNARRDNATNAYWGLPIFHPRLHLAADGPALAVGAEQEFHRYETSGERIWSDRLPSVQPTAHRIECGDLPTREGRLSRLGLAQTARADQVRTGYLRLSLDTLLNAGWLKQVVVDDIDDADQANASLEADTVVQIGCATFEPGISIIRACWNVIAIGTQNGLVHVFDWEGGLNRTFSRYVADGALWQHGLACRSRRQTSGRDPAPMRDGNPSREPKAVAGARQARPWRLGQRACRPRQAARSKPCWMTRQRPRRMPFPTDFWHFCGLHVVTVSGSAYSARKARQACGTRLQNQRRCLALFCPTFLPKVWAAASPLPAH